MGELEMVKLDLSNKVAIVSGGGGGIGRVTAITLAELGASVVVSDINYENAKSVSDEIQSMGFPGEAIGANVTQEADANKMVEKTLEKFGKVDILVNCAGTNKNMSVTETTVADWDRIYDINVKGTFLGIRAALPYMIQQKSGKIVNFSSMLGKEAIAYAVPYSSSKFAVMGITQGVAKEVAPHNINVNAVCPGIVMTELMEGATENIAKMQGITTEELKKIFIEGIPLGRFQTAQDVANTVAFLCSDLAENITGQGINISGGARVN
jgi:meso-butanediol dehydrogenase / (S,S)-butanediol dehydrogenase / diacetyl reductase